MSNSYLIEAPGGVDAGIAVRQQGRRGFVFHTSSRDYAAMDGHVFVTPEAALRAVRDFARTRRSTATVTQQECFS